MFLRSLKSEQKELVLGLAIFAAKANKIIDQQEERCIAMYADEMGIDINQASTQSLQEICSELKRISSKQDIHKIVFEITGLVFSDYDYDDEEKNFMETIITKLGVSGEVFSSMENYVKEYFELIKKINNLVNS